MDGEITVEVNGIEIKLPERATLGDAIRVSDAPYKEGISIGILKRSEIEQEENVVEYRIITTSGEFVIELFEKHSSSKKQWADKFREYRDMPLRWISRDAVAFGPFASEMVPRRETGTYREYELLFAAGGGDPHNTHLIITKDRHSAEYGAPLEGSFGRVVSGKSLLDNLEKKDRIIEIKPVISWKQTGEHLLTTDLTVPLEDGEKVFTFLDVAMSAESPRGAEHFFAVIRSGSFKVDMVSSSFISDHALIGELPVYENYEPRTRGSVFLRTVGYGSGKAFISTDDRTASILHSVIGHVEQGMELVNMAEVGHRLLINTTPPQIMLHGKSFREAEEELAPYGVKLIREGDVADEAVIVAQEPDTTIEILRAGTVRATGVDGSKMVSIELYDNAAPITLDFFRHAIGLQFRPVGIMPLIMMYENTYIFKAEKPAERYKEILPENTPKEKVASGEIGVTNQAAKRMGMVGVKTKDDDLFGPTGEKFISTNIIGRILDIEKLRNFKEGDKIYVIERNREGGHE
ncbi:methyl-coenzyme M reductase-associated protein Mmp3 [Methanomethylovorans sp.]|uniref:methyl-coenzyme M reductase-associated protein Mmp3 n=1 Tax=Methanomethylovorans sp. TaxID=2758717 RepID=UPI002FDE789F